MKNGVGPKTPVIDNIVFIRTIISYSLYIISMLQHNYVTRPYLTNQVGSGHEIMH